MNRIIVMTGATRGIGLSTAAEFLKAVTDSCPQRSAGTFEIFGLAVTALSRLKYNK